MPIKLTPEQLSGIYEETIKTQNLGKLKLKFTRRFVGKSKYPTKMYFIICPDCKKERLVESSQIRSCDSMLCHACNEKYLSRNALTKEERKAEWTEELRTKNLGTLKLKSKYILRRGAHYKCGVLKCPQCGKERLLEHYFIKNLATSKLCKHCSTAKSGRKNILKAIEKCNGRIGKQCYQYKGGYYIKGGYKVICIPNNDPYAECAIQKSSKNRVAILEHRYKMCQHLRRPLRNDEHLHHLDFNPKNNSIENLQIVTAREHQLLHIAHRKSKNGNTKNTSNLQ